jgi:hypothetical protein
MTFHAFRDAQCVTCLKSRDDFYGDVNELHAFKPSSTQKQVSWGMTG